MLIEAHCNKGMCERWDENSLACSMHPQCPTCKGYDTWINTDEWEESIQPLELEGDEDE